MPKKSVREMNFFERMHYSLSSKMFHTILMFSIVLSLVAVSFGFFLYARAIRNRYSDKAYTLSANVSLALDKDLIADYITKTKKIYVGLDQNTKEDINSTSYLNSFKQLKDENYDKVLSLLEEFATKNGADNIIIGYGVNNKFINIFSVNKDGLVNEPGFTQVIEEEQQNIIETLNQNIPIFDVQSDSFYCLGNTFLNTSAGSASIVTYFSLNDVVRLSRAFLLQYFIVLFVVTAIIDYFIVRKMKKTVVKPIVALNEAARDYMMDNDYNVMHFSNVDIHSGDEIESLALIMSDMEKKIAKHVQDIVKINGEKEKMGAELNVASQIQEGMLPNIFPAFPDRSEFEIYASMHTAKEVGGDFYDFFLIDDDHLATVIADVSGKGIPAALFMMASKIVINNLSTIGINDPGEILREVNNRIVKNNPVEMFVTVWLGVLEISTGKLKAANAGHEYPCLCKSGGKYEMVKDKHGLVIGGIENCKYQTYELQLNPGDSFFVYTDGVPEATNAKNELFGNERLLSALNDDPSYSVVELLDHVKERVDGFVKEAPRFDDITMLALRYFGKETDELTIDANIENIPTVTAFVDKKLEALNCPEKVQRQIAIAIDELFSNVAKYAYRDSDGGNITVRVKGEENPKSITISFIDNGKEFNPLDNKEPDVSLAAEDREIGGLGIYLVKKTMDDISYEYVNNQNVLTIKKGF